MRAVAALAASALMLASCGNRDNADAEALAVVGKSALTRTELSKAMPGGLTSADSTAFARAYIQRWVNARLIEQVAEDEVDMAEIDRLTSEYRLSLIMSQYRRSMATQAAGDFSEDSLRAYYEAHKADYRLERPLVRGVYLKVPDNAVNLAVLRRLYTSSKSADMDRLEKEAPKTAIHYDYFRDRWVDWEQIENRIPADISSGDVFLRSKRQLDVTNGGFIYLLHVSDYLPSGAPMPFEAAAPLIRERLLTLNRQIYDASLLKELYDRAVGDGTLTFPQGNPF